MINLSRDDIFVSEGNTMVTSLRTNQIVVIIDVLGNNIGEVRFIKTLRKCNSIM